MIERIIVPKDMAIYIGTRKHRKQHSCKIGYDGLRQVCCVFLNRSGRRMKLTAYKCPVCGKIFMHGLTYENHWYELPGYQFRYSRNGGLTSGALVCQEMYPQDCIEPPEPVDWDEVYKTPTYIVQGLRRPYLGGRFSGK